MDTLWKTRGANGGLAETRLGSTHLPSEARRMVPKALVVFGVASVYHLSGVVSEGIQRETEAHLGRACPTFRRCTLRMLRSPASA